MGGFAAMAVPVRGKAMLVNRYLYKPPIPSCFRSSNTFTSKYISTSAHTFSACFSRSILIAFLISVDQTFLQTSTTLPQSLLNSFKMMFTKTLGLAALFSTIASALPQDMMVRRAGMVRRDGGGVKITNNLQQDVYAWSVTDNVGPMQTIKSGGGIYSEDWRTNPNGGGISIKLALDEQQHDVLQFEYTQSGDTIFWDLSCIDMESGNKFTDKGFAVQPSEENSSCPKAICKAGDKACSAAYLQPTDDHATHGCPINTALDLSIGA
ncbi:unnamed protein product [Penicillium salamii]|nr:unnamed protein product [Penicillium salamii]